MGKDLTVGKKTEIINPLYKTLVKSHISRYTVLITPRKVKSTTNAGKDFFEGVFFKRMKMKEFDLVNS